MSRETPYIQGFTVKPAKIDEAGIVKYTDGTNEIPPNQRQCEAYGYTYDVATSTCRAFTPQNDINLNIMRGESNNTQGQNNVIGVGATNTYIMGQNNTVVGNNSNNIIIGSGNQIQEYVSNSNVFGYLGNATANNSIILGGNTTGDYLGERQSITVMFGRTTTDGTNKSGFMNNTTDSYFPVPENTAIYFHADVVAVRVGGVSGSGAVGDFASWTERGVVINKSGTASIERKRDTIKSSGTVTGWQPTGIVVSGTTSFAVRVRGATDMTIEWAATVRMTQMKTNVAL